MLLALLASVSLTSAMNSVLLPAPVADALPSNGTSSRTTPFADLWPIHGQPGQYRFPSFISTRKSVLLFVSGPHGVEIRRSTDSGNSWSAPWPMIPAIGVAQALYDPGSDTVLVLHRHPANPVNGTCEQICG